MSPYSIHSIFSSAVSPPGILSQDSSHLSLSRGLHLLSRSVFLAGTLIDESILVTTPIYKNHEKHQMLVHESPIRMYKHHVWFIEIPLEWTLVWLKALFFGGSEAVERMIQVTKSARIHYNQTGNWEPWFKKIMQIVSQLQKNINPKWHKWYKRGKRFRLF